MKNLNEISYDIRKACFDIHNKLGPGMLESVYEAVLAHKLYQMGYNVKTQVPIPVIYENIKLDIGFRIDLLVEDVIIVELKSVENLHPVHSKKLLTYLRLANKKLGLLINFNSISIDKDSFIRIMN